MARRPIGAGSPADGLTASPDSSVTSPRNLHGQIRACVLEHGFPVEEVLPLVTANTASVLQLPQKGRLREGADGDVVVLTRDALDIVEVIAGGRRLVCGGQPAVAERFLEGSGRVIRLVGTKA